MNVAIMLRLFTPNMLAWALPRAFSHKRHEVSVNDFLLLVASVLVPSLNDFEVTLFEVRLFIRHSGRGMKDCSVVRVYFDRSRGES